MPELRLKLLYHNYQLYWCPEKREANATHVCFPDLWDLSGKQLPSTPTGGAAFIELSIPPNPGS